MYPCDRVEVFATNTLHHERGRVCTAYYGRVGGWLTPPPQQEPFCGRKAVESHQRYLFSVKGRSARECWNERPRTGRAIDLPLAAFTWLRLILPVTRPELLLLLAQYTGIQPAVYFL
jgi:hypothetical protein